MHSTSQEVNNKIAKRIDNLKNQVIDLMRSRQIYDPVELFDTIYYNPEKVHHDYRELREAIQLAKNEGI